MLLISKPTVRDLLSEKLIKILNKYIKQARIAPKNINLLSCPGKRNLLKFKSVMINVKNINIIPIKNTNVKQKFVSFCESTFLAATLLCAVPRFKSEV